MSTDVLNFDDQKISGFKFLLADYEENFDYLISDGVLGLGLSTDDDSNFIRQLYINKVISSPRYSFFLSDSSRDSLIILDDLSEIEKYRPLYKSMSFCKVEQKSDYWQCGLDTVKIGSEVITINSKVLFDTGTSYLIIPGIYFNQLKPFLIDNNNSTCGLNEIGQLLCKCSSQNIFPDMELSLNGQRLKISFSKMIDYEPYNQYQCRFHVIVTNSHLFDFWILGDSVLRGMLLSFDVGTRTIGFNQDITSLGFNITQEINDKSIYAQDDKVYYIFALIFLIAGFIVIVKMVNNNQANKEKEPMLSSLIQKEKFVEVPLVENKK